MKKLLLAAALAVFSVSTSMAADTIVLKAKIGDVTFPHKMHQEMLTDCKVCH
jgi:hypothetical protein